MTNIVMNQELKGIEIYFANKPEQTIINTLKENGYRWHGGKKCWYAKQSNKTIELAQNFTEVKPEALTEQKEVKPIQVKKEENISLWDLTRFTQVETNAKQTTKEIAAEVRKLSKTRFPMVKFSITSTHSSINFEIVSSPYEKESIYLEAIKDYCTKLLESYKYCTSYDPYGDYGSSYNFYGGYARIDYQYKQTEQTEQTEQIKNDMLDFDTKLEEFEKQEEERKEREYQEHVKQQELDNIKYKEMEKESARQIEVINNSIEVKELEEAKQYFVIGSQFANLNKNNILEEYKEEVLKGDYELNNVKITKEIYFQNEEALNYFSNHLLTDFDWLEQTGGSYTDDARVNSMTDYDNMDKEEKENVIFNLYGVAIYINNKLQFVVDARGFSYARYVGLVENVKIEKNDPVKQLVNHEQIKELKEQAETLASISTSIIINDGLTDWKAEQWNEYKELMKNKLNNNNVRLSKAIIQQLPEELESLKVSMYRLLKEVDGIQEQFKDADLQPNQKITLIFMSDMGGIVTKRITLDEVIYTKYAQYDKAVKLIFKPEGKRKQYYNYFYSTLLVYDGWLNLQEDVLNTIESSNGMIITRSRFLSCDKKQYDEIIEHFASNGYKPIINTYKPIF